MVNSIQYKFVKCICEDMTKGEIRSLDFQWDNLKKLPGFPKEEKIKRLELCLISDSHILIKGDDDFLLFLEVDVHNDLFVKKYEMAEPIFLPSLDDEDALEYFSELAIEMMFNHE